MSEFMPVTENPSDVYVTTPLCTGDEGVRALLTKNPVAVDVGTSHRVLCERDLVFDRQNRRNCDDVATFTVEDRGAVKTKLSLSYDVRITSKLYEKLAPRSKIVFPHANEREYSSKIKLRGLRLPSDFEFIYRFQRQYYVFIENFIGYDSDTDRLVFDVDPTGHAAFDGLSDFEIVFRLDRAHDTGRVSMTSKVRLFHEKVHSSRLKTVRCSVAHENEMNGCFEFIETLDIRRFAKKICNVYAYFIRIGRDGEFYTVRVAFRMKTCADGSESDHCEIDVECEDDVQYGFFERVCECIFAYFTWQYAEYDGRVVDVTFGGSVWKSYRSRARVDVGVLDCLENAQCVSSSNQEYGGCGTDHETSVYDDFVNFIIIKKMYNYDDTIKSYIDTHFERLRPFLLNVVKM
ncbi:uncharacterized protein LOC112598285 [Melanaphis sacchari]|uniref:uncharacterized protein LOC112598285 n=1 Tax=Melanaphis sacchari TaxID=742174 RepID=UPI000DC14A72|nr:uncharacterized protein LOC112598285 [Melanaphis sacchari]